MKLDAFTQARQHEVKRDAIANPHTLHRRFRTCPSHPGGNTLQRTLPGIKRISKRGLCWSETCHGRTVSTLLCPHVASLLANPSLATVPSHRRRRRRGFSRANRHLHMEFPPSPSFVGLFVAGGPDGGPVVLFHDAGCSASYACRVDGRRRKVLVVIALADVLSAAAAAWRGRKRGLRAAGRDRPYGHR